MNPKLNESMELYPALVMKALNDMKIGRLTTQEALDHIELLTVKLLKEVQDEQDRQEANRNQ